MQKMCSILCWTHGSVSIRGFLSTLNKINKHDSTYWLAFLSQRGMHGDLHEWMTRNIILSNGVSLLLKVVQWLSSLIRINSLAWYTNPSLGLCLLETYLLHISPLLAILYSHWSPYYCALNRPPFLSLQATAIAGPSTCNTRF